MSPKPLTPFRSELNTGVWAAKLRALGSALDAQRLTFRDMCILEVPNGFVLHGQCKTKDGQFWSSITREFSLSDFAISKLS